MKATPRKPEPSPVDLLEQAVATASQQLEKIESDRDAIDAALVAAGDEHAATQKATAVELRRLGEAKAAAWQRGSPQPSLRDLEIAERTQRAAAQGVAALQSSRAEIQRIWKAARIGFLQDSEALKTARINGLQADFTAIAAERLAANQALDERERGIHHAQQLAMAERDQIRRELGDLQRSS